MNPGEILIILSLSLFINGSFSLPPQCELKVDEGKCQRSLYRYYYDHASGDCQRFIYTGCGGNGNRFIRRSHCREKCMEGKIPPFQEMKQTETVVPMSSRLNEQTSTQPFVPPVSDDTTKPPVHCSGCDPLFGLCLPDGKCGCKKGYKKAGRICIDLDECELSGICPDTATCINTLGGFHCNCGPDTKCEPKLDPYEHLTPPPSTVPPSTNPPFIYTPPPRSHPTTDMPALDESSCAEPFDIKLNENCGVMLPRFYYESISKKCRAVLYGGCQLTSKNVFSSRKDCENLCVKKFFKPRVQPSDHDENSILPSLPSSSSSSPLPSTSSSSTTQFPPLPWESHSSTTTSPDPFNLLSRSRSFTVPSSTKPTDLLQSPPSTLSTPSLPSHTFDIPQSAPSPLSSTHSPPPSSIESEGHLDDIPVSSYASTCLLPFDESLRQECITSTWTERFYYDSQEQSCIAFWYDSSCAKCDHEGKNHFENEVECMKCKNGFDPKKDLIEVTPPLSISLKEKNHFTTHSPMKEVERSEEEKGEEVEEEKEEADEEEKEKVEFHSTSTSTSTPVPSEEQEEEEKRKTEDAYLSIKNSGSCSGILDTRLEDDCDNGNWDIKFFFSSEKGKCRPFWYGGCKVDVHNFYPSEEACKLSCGTEYPVEEGHFQQEVEHYHKKEEKKEMEQTTTTTQPPTTTTPEVVSWTTKLAPMDIEISGEEWTTTSTTSEQPNPLAYTVYPIEHSIKNRGSISYTTTEMSHPAEEEYDETELPPSIPAGAATDPCDDPIDPRLEEECSSTWEYRSYFDASAKKCIKFWFGGCEIKSRNLFLDAEACRAVCHHKLPSSSPMVVTTLPPPTTTSIPSTTSIIPTTSPLRESPSTSSQPEVHEIKDQPYSLPQSAPLTSDPHTDLPQQTVDSFQDDDLPQSPPVTILPSESPLTPETNWNGESTGEMKTSKVPKVQEIKDHESAMPEQEETRDEKKKGSTISLKGFTASFVTKVTVRSARESPPPSHTVDVQDESTVSPIDHETQSTEEPTTLAYTSTTEAYVPTCMPLVMLCFVLPWLQ